MEDNSLLEMRPKYRLAYNPLVNRRKQKLTASDRSLSSPAEPVAQVLRQPGSLHTVVESGNRKVAARRVTDGGQTAGLLLHNFRRRRESFLYRSDSDVEDSTRSSRNQSLTGDDTSIGTFLINVTEDEVV